MPVRCALCFLCAFACVRLVSCHINLDLPVLALHSRPSPLNPSFHLGLGIFLVWSLLPHAGTFRCTRYPRTDWFSSLSTCRSARLYLFFPLCPSPHRQLSFSQAVWPTLFHSSTLCNTTTAWVLWFSPLATALPYCYDVGLFRHSCAPLNFEADITANQTVSPFTDSNVTAANHQHSSRLASRLTDSRPVRPDCFCRIL